MKLFQSVYRYSSPSWWMIGLVLYVCGTGAQAVAVEEQSARFSQSTAVAADSTLVLQEKSLDLAVVSENKQLVRFGSRVEAGVNAKGVAAHPGGHAFEIYDAQTELNVDHDGDGYYHRLRVSFDADVDRGEAHVYAALYLSLEGGPWNHYFTTDIFHILEDRSYDDYVVVTRLLDGYPSGYYDVLIELYDADTKYRVASYGPYDDPALSALPLEDQIEDDGHYTSTSYGGGGSLSWATLLLISLRWLFVGKHRQTKSPDLRNKVIKGKD